MESRKLTFVFSATVVALGAWNAFTLNRSIAPPAGRLQQRLSLEQPLSLDPAVTTQTLPNGMTFYIRHNERPKKRVSLRLAVKAGSLFEDEDQRGLAHFVEHMAFNGTAHFAPGELMAFLSSVGARYGADANAYTGFDRTVYMLDVPTDKEGLVERGLLALSDFAGQFTLGDAQVENERGVVIEEWRSGLGAAERVQNAQLPMLFHGSRYADRLPIGIPSVIRLAPAERLRAFVRDFYRPDRMAVVVVGDIARSEVEAQIRRIFGTIPSAIDRRVPASSQIPVHQETLVSVATDAELQGSTVSVVYKASAAPSRTVGDSLREAVDLLVSIILNERLADLARRPEVPFLAAAASGGEVGGVVAHFTVQASVADGGTEAALRSLLIEGERLRRYGANADELERAKKNLMAMVDSGMREKDSRDSADLAEECLDHFLEREIHASVEFLVELARTFLPTVTLADVQTRARALIHDDNRVVLVAVPKKAGANPPTESELRRILSEAGVSDIRPLVETMPGIALMTKRPLPGHVTASRKIEPLGVTVLSLSNGVEVWLKPTDFKQDEVLIMSYALGGASVARPEEVNEARLIDQYLDEAGLGGLSSTELQRALAGKLVGGETYVGDYAHGLTIRSGSQDLETALQLTYLVMTQLNDRPEGFERVKRKVAAFVTDRSGDPKSAFRDKVDDVNTQDHYLSRAPRPDDITAMKLSSLQRFYRQSFGNAADFVFFIVGAFDPAKVTLLVERYVGALPSTGRPMSHFVDRGLGFPVGVQAAEVHQGTEPQSLTEITFFADTGLDPAEIRHVNAAARILTSRLREKLRGALSGTYSVSASYHNEAPLRGYGTTTVSFGSDPARAAVLAEEALTEVAQLRDRGPSHQEVANEQEMERREFEVNMRENGYWINALVRHHQRRLDPMLILNQQAEIESLNVTSMKEAFRRYFPLDRRTQVTLLPEVVKSAKPGSSSR